MGTQIIDGGSTPRIPLYCVLATDHLTPATGKTIAVTISKNGAAFGNPSGGATNATEIGHGWYYVDLSGTDTGTNGPLIILGTSATTDDSTIAYIIGTSTAPTAAQVATAVWQDTTSGDFTVSGSIGKSLFTSGNSPGAANGLFIAGTNAATTITTSLTTHLVGTVDTVTTLTNLPSITTNWLTATGIASSALNGKGDWLTSSSLPSNFSSLSIDSSGRVDVSKIKGTTSAGAAGYIGIDWAAINAPTTTVNLSGTTISTSQAVASVSGSVGSVTGNVGGDVVGSVDSVTGNVGGSVGSISGVTFPTNFSALAIVPATGQVGIDWSNIYAATTSVNLSSTTISAGQEVSSVSGSVGSVTGSVASVSGNVGGSVGSVVGAVGSVTGSVGSISGVTFPTNFGSLGVDGNGNVSIQGSVKKNTALVGFPIKMVLTSDHLTAATGKTVTVQRSLDGASFANTGAVTATELANGWYTINLTSSDLNANTVIIRATASACDPTEISIVTQP